MSDEQSMIERVARAQAEAILGKGVPLDEDDYVRARAAIEEMREPTDAMLVAGAKAGGSAVQNGELWPDADSVGLVFSNIIDAALNEHANAR